MKDVQKELLAISTTLSSLVKQVEKMAETIEAESAKAAPANKVKAATQAKAPATQAKAPETQAKAPAKKIKARAKKAAVKNVVPAASEAKPAATAGGQTMLESILGMISRSRNGVTVGQLKKRTGLAARQVSNALYKLTKNSQIETLSRGLYVKKK